MSSIELTEYARGGGKTEKDAPSRCRCAAQMSKSPDVGKATKKRKSCPLCIPGIK